MLLPAYFPNPRPDAVGCLMTASRRARRRQQYSWSVSELGEQPGFAI